MSVNFYKLDKPEVVLFENLNYAKLISDNEHLVKVDIIDNDAKNKLPVHVIFGSGEYARIMSQSKP